MSTSEDNGSPAVQSSFREPIAGPGICMSQEQIALAMGISRTRVYQIEKRAVDKIRRSLAKGGFSEDDY